MSIATEVSRIQNNVKNAMSALEEKGVDTQGKNSDDLAQLIDSIETGGGDNQLDEFLLGTIENVVVPYGATIIRQYTFCDVTSLKNIQIPETVSTIATSAFQRCSQLELTEIQKGVKTFAPIVFNNCSKLVEITFNSTPNTIAGSAFSNCENLKTINVPWKYGEVANAPWGATNAAINYDFTYMI